MTKQKSIAERCNKNPFTIAVKLCHKHELIKQTAKVQSDVKTNVVETSHTQAFWKFVISQWECDGIRLQNGAEMEDDTQKQSAWYAQDTHKITGNQLD